MCKAADRWVKSTVAWEKFKIFHGVEKCLEVKYETLVKYPVKTVDRIGSKFKIPRSSRCDDGSKLNFGDVEIRTHHSNVLNPPSVKSIGKGRSKASVPVLQKIRPIIRDLVHKRGYPEI